MFLRAGIAVSLSVRSRRTSLRQYLCPTVVCCQFLPKKAAEVWKCWRNCPFGCSVLHLDGGCPHDHNGSRCSLCFAAGCFILLTHTISAGLVCQRLFLCRFNCRVHPGFLYSSGSIQKMPKNNSQFTLYSKLPS